MMDLAASAGLGCVTLAGMLSGVALDGGRGEREPRVEQAGSSALLPPRVQHAAYSLARPLGRLLIRAGLSANAITLASIPLAASAAVAFAVRHWGVGAVLCGMSYACDALDGLVARATGSASDSGEVLDAVCDRICEALMLGGIAVAWRSSVPLLALALFAALGAQQVTLASAKAAVFPAARGRIPRGLMRRAERAVVLVGAAAVAGAAQDLVPGEHAGVVALMPLMVAMGLIGVVGNASALHRFASLARALRDGAEEVRHADP
jgi:CDP-diacylglycerol--glycerol-3-phosphate 3-phosphatidyltransferase